MPSHQNNHAVLRQNTETGIEIDTTTQCRFQIEKYEDTLYEDALAELKQEFDNNRRVSIKMKIQIRKLLAKVECVNTSGSSNIVELTNILTKTQELLEHALEPSDYQKIANGVEGSPSQGMRAIGGIMLAICAIAVAL